MHAHTGFCLLSSDRKKYSEGVGMRLDKYLKVSRLIKRRTVANEACDAGRVLVNDRPAKASVNVKVGDVITIQFGNKEVKVEVLDVQETVRKEEAKELFRYLP
jgi:Ribosome-associated heat shock protein implicated in the recycling of the 50S subunit (S4 paralog)